MQSEFDNGYNNTIRRINEAVKNLEREKPAFIRLNSFLDNDDNALLGAAAAIETCRTQYPDLSFTTGLDDTAWLCLRIDKAPPPD